MVLAMCRVIRSWPPCGDSSLCPAVKMDILAGQPNELRGPKPSLDGQEEQRMVASPWPSGAVWAGQESRSLKASQKADERSMESLGRTAEHSLDNLGVLRGRSEA